MESVMIGKTFSLCKMLENPGECGVDVVYESQDAKPRRNPVRKIILVGLAVHMTEPCSVITSYRLCKP
jgi:hypothetical protein